MKRALTMVFAAALVVAFIGCSAGIGPGSIGTDSQGCGDNQGSRRWAPGRSLHRSHRPARATLYRERGRQERRRRRRP